MLVAGNYCKKDNSCEGCRDGNIRPTAVAGPDQVIALPLDSVWLDGSMSNDPDGSISAYRWTKLTGPAAASIVSPGSSATMVRSLAVGVYQFELLVTDDGGLLSRDTVQVSVNQSSLQTDGMDVYVAGDENSVPTYWKNGQGIALKIAAGQNGSATDIAVDGNDVYVAGWEGDFLDMRNNRAKYWKNGQEVFLTGATGAGANAIAVSGTDVYVAGYVLEASGWVAVYWKNGVSVTLTAGSGNAEATDIAVVGGDVYVSGYDGDVARVWRNGQPVGPSNVGKFSYASEIAVIGSDVYLAGMQDGKAAYWKNNQVFLLAAGEGRASSVYVSGTDVYVAGEVGGYGKSLARYWKNGQEVVLSGVSEAMIANSVFVMGDDVYVAGFEYGTFFQGGYWKNGQFVQLSPASNPQPTSILVIRR
jgi:hypothetical protein